MNKFCVGIVVLRQYERLEKCVTSILKSDIKPEAINIIDNGGCFFSRWEGVNVFRQKTNTGCAGGWNRAIKLSSTNSTIVCNDDLEVLPDTFSKMMTPESPCVVLGSGYSCFRIDFGILGTVGYFDEEYWPVYYEDSDYTKRMQIKGLKPIDLGMIVKQHGNHGEHVYQKFTSDEMKEFQINLEKNKQRFISKYGGLPSEVGV